jgi:LysR family hca operon transcriptional activator
MAMSLTVSTGGLTLLPAYAQNLLSSAVTTLPLQGEAPTIDLVMGYNKSNTSPILKRFLSRANEMIARTTQKSAGG